MDGTPNICLESVFKYIARNSHLERIFKYTLLN